MIPRVADRGYSFKGASQYYLHDKKADTNKRVAWTYTLNLPTEDPDKAFRYMAYTAMNAERLKYRAGVKSTGRKSSGKTVYSFSLAWHPEQEPNKETMLESALNTLGLLKLQEHEAVIVAHNDTEHPHIHVICNLIHPETGRTAQLNMDYLVFSSWAEEVERKDGEILCEQRVINNEKRRGKSGVVKHREQKLIDAARIEELYTRSDSGKAFQAAMLAEGYTLAQGDRRGYVLVDTAGKIYSLSRQLKNQRAADVKSRLKDVEGLPKATDLAISRTYYAAQQTKAQKKADDQAANENYVYPGDEFLRKLDEQRATEEKAQRAIDSKTEHLQQFYKRDELLAKIKELETLLGKKEITLDKLTGKTNERKQELEQLKKHLEQIDERIEQQLPSPEQLAEPDYPSSEQEAEKQKRLDYIKRMMKNPNRDKGRESEP